MLALRSDRARRGANSQVKLAAVEIDLGWPLPKYAIPVIVSVLWARSTVDVANTDHRRRREADRRCLRRRRTEIPLASRRLK
jgi:hypothetical protein